MVTTVRHLKDHLSDVLLRVQRGEEIIVTSRRRPVARIVPPSPGGETRRIGRSVLLGELERLRGELASSVRGEALSRTVARRRHRERY